MCGECNSLSSSLYASPPQSHSSLGGLLYYKPIRHVSWPTDTLRKKGKGLPLVIVFNPQYISARIVLTKGICKII